MKRKKRITTKKRVAKTPIIVKISLIIIVFFVLFATIFKITEIILTHKSDNFPKLEISLKDVSIEEVNAGTKDIKYPGNTIAITTDGKTTTYDDVEIKGRGNYTWGQIKKPYQIKFSEKTDLLGHGATKKWVLLADYSDQTHLRNDIAFYLADTLDENYTHQGGPIELYIDDNYRGLYYLIKKISTNKAGLNLKNEDGILVELDNSYGELDGCTYDEKNNCFITKDIINEDYTDSTIKDFVSSINSLHKAIKKQDYKAISEIIDVDSFAKYFLLSEFTANPDAYTSSFYMHKDGEEDKIHAGPFWDFDMALGNLYWGKEKPNYDKVHSPFETMAFKDYLTASGKSYASTIIYDLMEIPEFEARVKEIYQETLSGKGEQILDYIRSQANYIKPAVKRDQERWKSKSNFDEEIDYLIDWVAKRYDHFEQTYGISSDPAPESPQPSQE